MPVCWSPNLLPVPCLEYCLEYCLYLKKIHKNLNPAHGFILLILWRFYTIINIMMTDCNTNIELFWSQESSRKQHLSKTPNYIHYIAKSIWTPAPYTHMWAYYTKGTNHYITGINWNSNYVAELLARHKYLTSLILLKAQITIVTFQVEILPRTVETVKLENNCTLLMMLCMGCSTRKRSLYYYFYYNTVIVFLNISLYIIKEV